MHMFSSGKIQVFIQVGGYLPFGAGGGVGRVGGFEGGKEGGHPPSHRSASS